MRALVEAAAADAQRALARSDLSARLR
jgi:hypothetical protein